MYYQRTNHNHATTERPDINMWVDQIAIPAVNSDGWSFTRGSIQSDGSLLVVPALGTSLDSRYIPGIIDGHLYKVTIVCTTKSGVTVVLFNGDVLGNVVAPGTYTWYVRPALGAWLLLNSPTWSGGIFSSITFEALDPINLDLIPRIDPYY